MSPRTPIHLAADVTSGLELLIEDRGHDAEFTTGEFDMACDVRDLLQAHDLFDVLNMLRKAADAASHDQGCHSKRDLKALANGIDRTLREVCG